MLCQRTFSSVFRVVFFYTVKLHSLTQSVWGPLHRKYAPSRKRNCQVTQNCGSSVLELFQVTFLARRIRSGSQISGKYVDLCSNVVALKTTSKFDLDMSVHLYSTTNQIQHFLDLFISINFCTCFRLFLRPSSGAQNCTYSVRYCQTNTAACCYRG